MTDSITTPDNQIKPSKSCQIKEGRIQIEVLSTSPPCYLLTVHHGPGKLPQKSTILLDCGLEQNSTGTDSLQRGLLDRLME